MHRPYIITVASPQAKVGKTTAARALATNLDLLGYSVMVVDVNQAYLANEAKAKQVALTTDLKITFELLKQRIADLRRQTTDFILLDLADDYQYFVPLCVVLTNYLMVVTVPTEDAYAVTAQLLTDISTHDVTIPQRLLLTGIVPPETPQSAQQRAVIDQLASLTELPQVELLATEIPFAPGLAQQSVTGFPRAVLAAYRQVAQEILALAKAPEQG
ncbi:nucleotide-binding protein [Loigolactobacillus binensis]|uniref:CobQ/CobB/MinD/ParA nucleotide binding domain-containing protein n=1 Tax=Loigolactobacillus binensis TaxID=2559922 RepID=A0ABW3EFW7_9LACO|nr:ParA family protein [Loigolactobacillus binensis]